MGITKGGACRCRAMPPRITMTPLCGSEVVVCQPCAPAPSPVLPPSTACNCGRDDDIEKAIKANDLDAIQKIRRRGHKNSCTAPKKNAQNPPQKLRLTVHWMTSTPLKTRLRQKCARHCARKPLPQKVRSPMTKMRHPCVANSSQ